MINDSNQQSPAETLILLSMNAIISTAPNQLNVFTKHDPLPTADDAPRAGARPCTHIPREQMDTRGAHLPCDPLPPPHADLIDCSRRNMRPRRALVPCVIAINKPLADARRGCDRMSAPRTRMDPAPGTLQSRGLVPVPARNPCCLVRVWATVLWLEETPRAP